MFALFCAANPALGSPKCELERITVQRNSFRDKKGNIVRFVEALYKRDQIEAEGIAGRVSVRRVYIHDRVFGQGRFKNRHDVRFETGHSSHSQRESFDSATQLDR